MSSHDIQSIQRALKLLDDPEDSRKLEGVELMGQVLSRKNSQLVKLGYDQVIYKELLKLIQFEKDQTLAAALSQMENHYFDDESHWDELIEALIYRVGRSTDFEVSSKCLERLSTLIDRSDERIAKHSKQLLKLADINDMIDLNQMLCDILEKLKTKLPKRN